MWSRKRRRLFVVLIHLYGLAACLLLLHPDLDRTIPLVWLFIPFL